MLNSPTNNLDTKTMLDILRMVMQDSADYTWGNALGFYEMIGRAVEKAEFGWGDADNIRELCMQFSRAVFPEKKEARDTKDPPRQLKMAPPGMRCCTSFQKRTCELTKDHPPFTHACCYCFRTSAALCRHAEDECMRKTSDEPKNGKKRDP